MIADSTGRTTSRRKLSPAARIRVLVSVLVVSSLALVGMAVTGKAPVPPGLEFIQVGHWVYNAAFESAYHVDGSTNRVDARVKVPGVSPGSQVVQGERSGYVVGKRITVFSKQTLSVESSMVPPAEEEPVALEAAGGPYLVYRDAGRVARMGDPIVTIPAGGQLAGPVVTADGTLWVHRVDTGLLCELPRQATRLACQAQLPPGHQGVLALVDDRPVVVDTTSDTMRFIGSDGLGEPVLVGLDLPPAAQVANSAVAGRLAVVDPERRQLHMVDTAGLTKDRPVTRPVPPVELAKDGKFAGPVTTGQTVAVVDETRNELHTYDTTSGTMKTTKVPGKGGAPRLALGEDNRIYVDAADGSRVLVVNGEDGIVVSVPVGGPVPVGGEDPTSSNTQTGSAVPSGGTADPNPGTTATNTAPPASNPNPPQATHNPPPRPPVAAATPPGAPGDIDATAGDGSATVTWQAPANNGAPITAYHLSWRGGSMRVSGPTTRATVGGLVNGTSYVITVVAENSAGRGPGADSRPVIPVRPAAAPNVTGTINPDSGVTTVNWNQPDLGGGALVHYVVSVPGQADKQVNGTSTTYADASGTVTVRAVTKSGSSDVNGAPGSTDIAPLAKRSTGNIARVQTAGPDSIAVTVNVTTYGNATTCEYAIGFYERFILSAPCAGTSTVLLRGVYPGPFGFHHVNVELISAQGRQALTDWISVPEPCCPSEPTSGEPGFGFVIWLPAVLPAVLAAVRRRKDEVL